MTSPDSQEIKMDEVDSSYPHIHVTICACSPHTSSHEVHILSSSPSRPPYIIINYASLPTVGQLLSNLIPVNTDFLHHKFIQNNLHLFQEAQSKLHALSLHDTIIPRAGKYIRRPWLVLNLFHRAQNRLRNALGLEDKVHTNSVYNLMGFMSLRLWFNIWMVIIWVLIRKFLELFGIYFDCAVRDVDGLSGVVVSGQRDRQEVCDVGGVERRKEEVRKSGEKEEGGGLVAEEATWASQEGEEATNGSVDGWQRIG